MRWRFHATSRRRSSSRPARPGRRLLVLADAWYPGWEATSMARRLPSSAPTTSCRRSRTSRPARCALLLRTGEPAHRDGGERRRPDRAERAHHRRRETALTSLRRDANPTSWRPSVRAGASAAGSRYRSAAGPGPGDGCAGCANRATGPVDPRGRRRRAPICARRCLELADEPPRTTGPRSPLPHARVDRADAQAHDRGAACH